MVTASAHDGRMRAHTQPECAEQSQGRKQAHSGEEQAWFRRRSHSENVTQGPREGSGALTQQQQGSSGPCPSPTPPQVPRLPADTLKP